MCKIFGPKIQSCKIFDIISSLNSSGNVYDDSDNRDDKSACPNHIKAMIMPLIHRVKVLTTPTSVN